jgi:hypothetical protein
MVIEVVRISQGPGICIQQLELNGVRVAPLHAHEAMLTVSRAGR